MLRLGNGFFFVLISFKLNLLYLFLSTYKVITESYLLFYLNALSLLFVIAHLCTSTCIYFSQCSFYPTWIWYIFMYSSIYVGSVIHGYLDESALITVFYCFFFFLIGYHSWRGGRFPLRTTDFYRKQFHRSVYALTFVVI